MWCTCVFFSLCYAVPEEHMPYGEPYEMKGTRLVFSTWHFIRTGTFSWIDPGGKPAYAAPEYRFAPEECRWQAGADSPWGVRIRVCPPDEIRKPDIPLEKPWETSPITPECIVEENGVYKMWASCGAPCYLESSDGLHWERPIVGLAEFGGNNANNLLPQLPRRNVFIDPSSQTERYKCVYEAMIS